MSDTYSPLLLTIAADGRVTADFEGHISAEGLDLDMGETATPPEDRKIRWLRASDGTRLAEIYAWHGGAGFPEHALLSLRAYDHENPNSNAELEVNAGGDGSAPSRVLAAAGLESRVIVRGDGASDFVRANVVGSNMRATLCRVRRTAAKSIAHATGTFLDFDAERYDTHGFHDNATNNTRLTVPAGEGGYYLVTAHVVWAVSTGGMQRSVELWHTLAGGGSTVKAYVTQGPTVTVRQSISTVLELAAGDYVRTLVYQDSGGNLNVNVDSNASPEMTITRVG